MTQLTCAMGFDLHDNGVHIEVVLTQIWQPGSPRSREPKLSDSHCLASHLEGTGSYSHHCWSIQLLSAILDAMVHSLVLIFLIFVATGLGMPVLGDTRPFTTITAYYQSCHFRPPLPQPHFTTALQEDND
jgi:hypothetical protein